MRTLACLNGVIGPVEEARVSVWDRGFVFGDSVYEVFRMYGGRLWLEREHLDRLARSVREVEFPEIDFARLSDRIAQTIRLSEVEEGTVYIQVTRGVAPRAHLFPRPAVEPTELIIVRPYDDGATAKHREQGVAASTQPDRRWGRCDIKTTNLLPNVIALEHAARQGAFEAILFDHEDMITEATHSSLLWIRAGALFGTPEGFEILPGTKRHFIEDLARDAGVAFATERLSRTQIFNQDEVILSGTTIEVMPVISIDGKAIGSGKPGAITTKLQQAYSAKVRSWLDKSAD